MIHDGGSYLMSTDATVVTQASSDAEHPVVRGYHTQDGSAAWTLDTKTPPGVQLNGPDSSLSGPSVTAAGQGFVVTWRGTPQNSGKPSLISAAFSAETGKQVGKTLVNELGQTPRATTEPAPPFAANVFSIGSAGDFTSVSGKPQWLFGDGSTGTVVHQVKGVDVNFTGDQPLVPTSPRGGFAAWPPDTTHTRTWTYQAYEGESLTGSPTTCAHTPDLTSTKAVGSPNGRFIGWGAAVIDVKTQHVRCLDQLQDRPVTINQVGDDGATSGSTLEGQFSAPAGSTSPTPLDRRAPLPLATLSNGITIATGNDAIVGLKK
ncbi:hypothetical protein [Dermacoccus sp. UBA1591]|nr:hypothetical protein [Dermacoccus sp. UBA1591]